MSSSKNGAKLKWTSEEERALRQGVSKHGVGKWRNIQKDEEFAGLLANRTNVDLKDKWRNLKLDNRHASSGKPAGRGGREPKAAVQVVPRQKKRKNSHPARASLSGAADEPSSSLPPPARPRASTRSVRPRPAPAPAPAAPASPRGASPSTLKRTGPLPDDMVVAAVISLQDSSGSTAEEIADWIEAHYGEVASQRKQVRTTLRHMAASGRLDARPATGRQERYALGGCVGARLKAEAEAGPGPAASGASQGARAGGHIDSLQGSQAHAEHCQQTAVEAAEAAAEAVAEAEEAAAVAHRLADLSKGHLHNHSNGPTAAAM